MNLLLSLALLTSSLTNLQGSLQAQPVYAEVIQAPIQPVVKRWDKQSIIAYIKKTAEENNVDVSVALAIVQAESRFNPKALGDNSQSRGLWQIHHPSHPDITNEQAYDVEYSTQWAIKELKEGKCSEWSTCPLGQP